MSVAMKDDNDLLRDGQLGDPFDGTEPVQPRDPRLRDAMREGLADSRRPKSEVPLLSGFRELDEGMGDYGLGEVTYLVADSGVGKSTVATQWALHVGELGYGVEYFNLEMTEKRYAVRTAAQYASQPVKLAVSGRLDDERFEKLRKKSEDLDRAAHHIVLGNQDHAAQDLIRAHIERNARELEREGTPLRLVVIDHMLHVPTRARNNPDAEGKERALFAKAIAKEFKVHVLGLIHVTGERAKTGKMPTKNDIAGGVWYAREGENIIIFHQKRNADMTFADTAEHPAILSAQKTRWSEAFAVKVEYHGGFFFPWSLKKYEVTPGKRAEAPRVGDDS